MKNPIVLLFLLATMSIGWSESHAQQQGKQKPPAGPVNIEVIQFHLEHRCVSCLNIENFTKATLAAAYPTIPFKLVNVEKKENEKLAEQFEATGSSLFLYNKATGKKQNLTQFAFLAAGDEKKFQTDLKQYINAFSKEK
jgi:hypothetical protein